VKPEGWVGKFGFLEIKRRKGCQLLLSFSKMSSIVFDDGVRFFRLRCDSVVLILVLSLNRAFVLPKRMGLQYGMSGHKDDFGFRFRISFRLYSRGTHPEVIPKLACVLFEKLRRRRPACAQAGQGSFSEKKSREVGKHSAVA
jgi:hypothetical protein